MKETLIGFMKQSRVVAVVRSDSYETSLEFARACIDGGIKLIEVISSSPGAKKLIAKLAEQKGIYVGAGTVLDLNSTEQMSGCGARFIVSPHTDSSIIEYCSRNSLVIVSGAFTSSEMIAAHSMGADFVKVFPSSSFGPSYIKAIKKPLGFIQIMVTGGINLNNIEGYFDAGATLAGISTALVQNGEDYESVKIMAGRFSKFCG